jgi:hypothetical protein
VRLAVTQIAVQDPQTRNVFGYNIKVKKNVNFPLVKGKIKVVSVLN